MTCACGHERDEHDDQGECQVDDCPCFYFEAEPADGDDDEVAS